MERIGILGGTFDPVHNGHLRLAIEVGAALSLARTKLMVAPNPRLRGAPEVDAETRLRMLAAAVHDVPGLAIDARELEREGPTSTVDTLESLRAEHPGNPLWLIVGMDAFSRFDGWTDWSRIPELAHIAVAKRPGSQAPTSPAVLALLAERTTDDPRAVEGAAGAIAVVDIPAMDISATRIRTLRRRGASIRFLVPESVHDIITTEDLYTRDH